MKTRTILMLTMTLGVLFGAGCQKNTTPTPAAEIQNPAATTTQTPSAEVATTTPTATTTEPATEKPTIKTTATSPQIPKGPVTIYTGQGCPHCARVELRAAETGMDKKIPIIFKEVFNDQANAEEFLGVAKTCGLDVDNLGVPVMWDGTKCTEGEPDIIKFIDLTTQAYAKRK